MQTKVALTETQRWTCTVLDVAGLLVDNGHKYGSAWLKRDLPPDVIRWAEGKAA